MVPTQPACYAQRVVPEDQEDTQALGSWAATPYLACLASNAAGSELLLSPVCVCGGGGGPASSPDDATSGPRRDHASTEHCAWLSLCVWGEGCTSSQRVHFGGAG